MIRPFLLSILTAVTVINCSEASQPRTSFEQLSLKALQSFDPVEQNGAHIKECTESCRAFYHKLFDQELQFSNSYGDIMRNWKMQYPRHKGIAEGTHRFWVLNHEKLMKESDETSNKLVSDNTKLIAYAAELKETIEQINHKNYR